MGLLLVAATLASLAACSAAKPSSPAPSTATAAERLGSTIASASAAAGTFLCAPPGSAVDACSDSSADRSCKLFDLADHTYLVGICRPTLDRASVACGPKFPTPPQEIVEPCQGKAPGRACEVVGLDGERRAGACVPAFDGMTLVCGRASTPAQALTDPCSGVAAGDRCSAMDVDGRWFGGVCGLGPGGSKPLACTPAQDLQPALTAPCKALVAGDACTVGRGDWALSGRCLAPAAGGAPVCVVPCDRMAGGFPGGPGSSSGAAVGGSLVAACDGRSAGAICTVGHGQWAMTGQCLEIAPAYPSMCIASGCRLESGSFDCGAAGSSSSGGSSSGGSTSSSSSSGSSSSSSSGGSSSSSSGGPTGCVKGQTQGRQVAVIGESFIALSHGITRQIEADAGAAGSLAQGDHYVDNSVSGTTLANGQIPGQYARAVQSSGTIRYVLMDGGGNDCLLHNDGDAALAAATSLFQTMAQHGTEKVVYFFYPDPVGSNFAGLKTCLDTLRPRMKALCDGLTAPRCTWLDLRPLWNGHPEYTSDGIHPTSAGSAVTGDAIWKVMQDACVAQ